VTFKLQVELYIFKFVLLDVDESIVMCMLN